MINIGKDTYKRGSILGVLSGMTWGMDTTLLALALTLSPFSSDPALLLGGTFLCCIIHILFESITMTCIVARRREFPLLKKYFFTRPGLVCMAGAILGGPLAMTCFLLSIETNGAAMTSTITASYPLIGAILALFVLRERIAPQLWIGLLLCVFGIFYSGMFIPEHRGATLSIGILLAVGTAIGWGIEGVTCRFVVGKSKIEPRVALLIRDITCLVIYIIIAPFFLGGYDKIGDSLSEMFHHWEALIVLAGAAIIGAFSMYLWYRTIGDLGAARGLCLNSSYCIWTIVFGCLIFHHTPGLNTITGALIMICGLVIALWRSNLSLSAPPAYPGEE